MDIIENSVLLGEINRINMNILTMAKAKLGNDWECEAARAPYSRLYIIEQGEGEICYGNKRLPLCPGNIYIVPAELDFSYSCNDYLEKLYFHVNILRYNQYDLLREYKECIVLRNRQEDIASVLSAWNKQDIMRAVKMKLFLYKIFVEAFEQENLSLGDIEDYSDLVKRSLRVIDSNLHATLSAEDVAGPLHVSTGLLRKRFRDEVGVPLGRYIDDRLMFVAEQKLHSEQYSIRDISDQLGFCDQFYFSRCFCKRFGVSPKKYRKNIIT